MHAAQRATPGSVSNGHYVNLEKKDDGNLHIHLTAEGRREFVDIERGRNRAGIFAALHLLLEDHLSNVWKWVAPEEIGALTAAPILSDEAECDEFGQIVAVRRLFWFPDYAVVDEIRQLKRTLLLTFIGVDSVDD